MVSLDGDVLRIGNGFREIEVPTSHLKRIQECRVGKGSYIALYFTPQTEFGPDIRLVPRRLVWGREPFEDVAILLRAIVSQNLPPPIVIRPGIVSAEIADLVAHSNRDQPFDFTALAEEHLEELIERLPSDSKLRDAARRERQRRWYG